MDRLVLLGVFNTFITSEGVRSFRMFFEKKAEGSVGGLVERRYLDMFAVRTWLVTVWVTKTPWLAFARTSATPVVTATSSVLPQKMGSALKSPRAAASGVTRATATTH